MDIARKYEYTVWVDAAVEFGLLAQIFPMATQQPAARP